MGCGGSKEDVATGNNNNNNGAGRGSKLFRRKSTMAAASNRCSQASSPYPSADTSVTVKDVVKDPAAGEPKAPDAKADQSSAPEKTPVGAVVEEKKEGVVATAASTAAEAAPAAENPLVKGEDELPKSTMADEQAAAKVEEAEEETPPASRNQDGKSVEPSTTEPMKPDLVDEQKPKEAAAGSEPSLPQEKEKPGESTAN